MSIRKKNKKKSSVWPFDVRRYLCDWQLQGSWWIWWGESAHLQVESKHKPEQSWTQGTSFPPQAPRGPSSSDVLVKQAEQVLSARDPFRKHLRRQKAGTFHTFCLPGRSWTACPGLSMCCFCISLERRWFIANCRARRSTVGRGESRGGMNGVIREGAGLQGGNTWAGNWQERKQKCFQNRTDTGSRLH